MSLEQFQRLHKGDLVRLYDDRSDIFRVDLTPRRGEAASKVRLHSYHRGVVTVDYDAIVFDNDLAERMKERKPVDFSRFAAYFAADGLTPTEQTAIRDYLGKLCLRTGHLWKPGRCTNIPNYTEEARDELRSSSAKGVLTKIVPKRYIHNHFFWVSNKANELFIIDPTGVPADARNVDIDITPFFGLLENAKGFHKVVYENMQDMDNWGTRDLPPGFHP